MLQCLLCTTLDDSRKQTQNDVRNAPDNGREKARRKEHESHHSNHAIRLDGIKLLTVFLAKKIEQQLRSVQRRNGQHIKDRQAYVDLDVKNDQ